MVEALRASGKVEPIVGQEIVWTGELARNEALRLAHEGCEVTIFDFAVCSFPHLAVIATQLALRPFLLFSNINPQHRGWWRCWPPQEHWTKSASFVAVDKGTSFLKEGLKSWGKLEIS
ncbi:MAG: hypothetical protein QXQ66_08765 [Candidatus Hadarchaeum sp.]|uniref:hypothetical protein n=1 Tax=Candidatus Hadarchaeum sp. TaxID=2883567 RepID=UPI003181084C